MLIGRAPLRISFVGGGTDMEEYHNKFNGYAISATINKYTFYNACFHVNPLNIFYCCVRTKKVYL